MANYRISEDAKADLNRIYQRGVREYDDTVEIMCILGQQDVDEWI